MNWFVYCANNPIFYTDPSGMRKEGDERLPQDQQDAIDIYGQIWLDAEAAYNLGIISEQEKNDVQYWAETKADNIRNAKGNSKVDKAIEFVLFDIISPLGTHVVHAADYSSDGLTKMYSNEANLSKIIAAAAVTGSYDKGRTFINEKINKKMTRVDIEFPQGSKKGEVHLQIKGEKTKYRINSLADIDNLPKSIRKNKKIVEAIKKALKLLGKLV